MSKILTIGTFDILHFGHISFLQRCNQLLFTSPVEFVVGVNTDAFASTFKPAPIFNFYERIFALQQLGYKVVPNDSPGRELIESGNPDILIAGSDWADRNYLDQIDCTSQWLDEHNVTLLFLPRVHGLAMATSEIKQRILSRHDKRVCTTHDVFGDHDSGLVPCVWEQALERREATPEDAAQWIRQVPHPQDAWMDKIAWRNTL